MAKLLDTLARKSREKFFARLDLEWGRGFQYRTKSDRCPNPFQVTAPRNDIPEYQVCLYGYYADYEVIWSSVWRELAEAYVGTLRAEGFKARVIARDMPVLSKNQSANIALLVAEYREGCQNQTIVKRAADLRNAKVYRSTRWLPKPPSDSPETTWHNRVFDPDKVTFRDGEVAPL